MEVLNIFLRTFICIFGMHRRERLSGGRLILTNIVISRKEEWLNYIQEKHGCEFLKAAISMREQHYLCKIIDTGLTTLSLCLSLGYEMTLTFINIFFQISIRLQSLMVISTHIFSTVLWHNPLLESFKIFYWSMKWACMCVSMHRHTLFLTKSPIHSFVVDIIHLLWFWMTFLPINSNITQKGMKRFHQQRNSKEFALDVEGHLQNKSP